MEYRIEQLAQAVGVAVDTIRFYQGKGLLDPPRRDGRVTWYADRHLDRVRRIRALQQRGFTLAVIRRFLEGELETSDEALVEAVTAPPVPETMALDELAARSGLAVPLLRQLEHAGLLLPVSDGEEPRYPAEDVEVLAAGLKLVEAARRAVDLFDRHVRERIQAEGLPQRDAEQRLLQTFQELMAASGTLVRHHFQRALLRAARDRIEQTDRRS